MRKFSHGNRSCLGISREMLSYPSSRLHAAPLATIQNNFSVKVRQSRPQIIFLYIPDPDKPVPHHTRT
jgi:LmbE family N-acetylglucosaminyl deacetylase